MAKYFNNKVKSGKVAGSVFAVRYGETIERAYNPYVTNPSTKGQISARAKLKLLSQLSAVMGSVIAIPRVGAVSGRNLFTKKNYSLVTYNDALMQADVALTALQITDSVVGMATISQAFRSDDNTIQVRLNVGQLPADISRVVYAMFRKIGNSLEYVDSRVVSAAGNPAYWQADFPMDTNDVVFYAYGVRDNTEAARAAFGDLVTPNAQDIARIIVTSTLTLADVTLTKTVGYQLSAGPAPSQS